MKDIPLDPIEKLENKFRIQQQQLNKLKQKFEENNKTTLDQQSIQQQSQSNNKIKKANVSLNDPQKVDLKSSELNISNSKKIHKLSSKTSKSNKLTSFNHPRFKLINEDKLIQLTSLISKIQNESQINTTTNNSTSTLDNNGYVTRTSQSDLLVQGDRFKSKSRSDFSNDLKLKKFVISQDIEHLTEQVQDLKSLSLLDRIQQRQLNAEFQKQFQGFKRSLLEHQLQRQQDQITRTELSVDDIQLLQMPISRKNIISKSFDTFSQHVADQDQQSSSVTISNGAVPTPKMAARKIKKRQIQNEMMIKNYSYLDDVLIQEDINNVNEIRNQFLLNQDIDHPDEEAKLQREKDEQDPYHVSPLRRMEIKKELNDMFKKNFDSIEKKNYDHIIVKSQSITITNQKAKSKRTKRTGLQYSSKELSIFEQTSFNFNNFSGW
ncbi:UNKNOWN [Stylonychia lemnae]|uniref:Uncharacterized protein n=1 Tax=Stylonychia lemnae TaxID=5949 RepID=A0A078AI17_STYLE|nr:UNKNOWN [Stylonychia lemnae]|eukprot:CDW81581.1 UNKNOWN [Stylonychia lemnae]